MLKSLAKTTGMLTSRECSRPRPGPSEQPRKCHHVWLLLASKYGKDKGKWIHLICFPKF